METIQGTLRGSLQDRLLNSMIRKVGVADNSWKVLVVDRSALRILAAALPVNELVNERVSIIELIDMRREPLPRTQAIYFISPTPESVEHLVNESTSQYRSFHVFFTGRLPDYLMAVIREKKSILRRVKTLVELNVQFLAVESRLFSLDRPAASLPQMHAGTEKDSREEMSVISERLAEACMTLAPSIEWQVRSDASSSNSRTVSTLLKEQLESARLHKASNANADEEKNTGSDAAAPERDTPTNATILIVDRLSDILSPLLHEFTYQAMAHDLLPLNYQKPGGAHIEVDDEKNEGKTKFLQLDEEDKDPVWGSIRWMFIEEALRKAQDSLREFVETDAGYKIMGKGTQDLDIKDMGAAVRALPESQKRADKHALHIKCARDCLDLCRSLGLTDLSLVEQDLALGKSSDGTKLKSEVFIDTLIETLKNESIPIGHRTRLLLASLIVAEGLMGLGGETSALAFSATFRSRLRRSGIDGLPELTPELVSAIMGVRQLLQRAKQDHESLQSMQNSKASDGDKDTVTGRLRQKYATRQARKQHKRLRAERHKRHGLHNEEDLQYDVARYNPPLRSIMMDLVDEVLDEQAFPQTGAISVDSIIASINDVSAEESGDQGSSHSVLKNKLRSPMTKTRDRGVRKKQERSAAMQALVQSFGRSGSGQSASSEGSADRRADEGHLFVVFVVGGVCYSEVRAMYEVCAKREANILIGGSQVLTPQSYVDALGAVADPVFRIKVTLPPLPLELAQTRAARAVAEEAERVAAEEAARKARASRAKDGRQDSTISDSSFAGNAGDGDEGEVHIVTSYKKKRGLRLFGRRK